MSDDWFNDTVRGQDVIARDGAASDGAEAEAELAQLPRLLRYALVAWQADPRNRLVAELQEIVPDLAVHAVVWCEHPEAKTWQDLAALLDRTAVDRDLPLLRTFADVVRLLSMTIGDIDLHREHAFRILAALRAALGQAEEHEKISLALMAEVETMIVGWSVVAAGCQEQFVNRRTLVHQEVRRNGNKATERVRLHEREKCSEHYKSKERNAEAKAAQATGAAGVSSIFVPADHTLVCPPIDAKSSTKIKDAIRGHEHIVGKPIPLVAMPDIATVKRTLLFEFPYAERALDTLLAPMVGRKLVGFPPVLLVGSPGAGKSRLARRLAECLGVGLWRTDGGRADGSVFAGTDKRWYSAEPCHPLLAISRARMANPVVLVDEIDKAATRSDYGRLWDSLLGFLERETSVTYPDPCLQVDLNVSQVSYVATANSASPLPSPLLDRFRIIEMPEPRAGDLARLVSPLAHDILAEQHLDERWLEPVSAAELDLLARKWKGGSARRLRAYLAVLLRAREKGRPTN